MPMELRPVAARIDDRRPFTTSGADGQLGVRGCTGRVGDRRVVAVVTGMGTELAERGTNQLFDDPVGDEIEHVVVAGITGALSGRTPIGTLVRPEVVLRDGHDVEH